jgi:hypothetical protein
MFGLLEIPSPTLFVALPILVGVPFAFGAAGRCGSFVASVFAAVVASALHLAFLIFTLGFSATGMSVAAGITLVQYMLLCFVAVTGIGGLRRLIRAGG